MPESLNLSQPAWALLDMIQQQLGVSVEVLDPRLRPLAPAGVGDAAGAMEQPGLAGEVQKSLKSGEVRIDRTTGLPIGIFPLRVARQIAGVLIVVRRVPRTLDVQPTPEVNVERAGHLARLALEADLGLTSQLSDARYRTRRAQGILRFLAQLGALEADRASMHAVTQAATVWFDVDCRIYEHQPDDTFLLAATLPGVEQKTGLRIDNARAQKLIASRRFSSGGDLEDLGLSGRREEVLVLPVGLRSPEWLMILAGAIDQEVDLTFTAIARVLAWGLQAREVARIDMWQQRLVSIEEDTKPGARAPERVLLKLLESLAAEAGAVAARVTLVAEGTERALAALGPATPSSASETPDTAGPAPGTQTACIQISPNTAVQISVTTPAVSRAAALELSSWMKALQPWLREVIAGLASQASLFDTALETSSFEQRIQEEIERAKRFNLGLGLVLIGDVKHAGHRAAVMESVVAAVRSELRASDLLGRIRDGQVAVLLVHAEPVGADSVVGRLRSRLEILAEEGGVSAVRLGRAVFSPDCASADALIAQALRQTQSFELRN